MTKHLSKFILTASFLVIVTAVTWAQDQDCLSKLDGAATLFNTGLFEDVLEFNQVNCNWLKIRKFFQ